MVKTKASATSVRLGLPYHSRTSLWWIDIKAHESSKALDLPGQFPGS